MGSEFVVNGNFDTDTSGWTAGLGTGASIAWNAGKYVDCYAGTDLNALIRQTITGLVVGKTYAVQATILATNQTTRIYIFNPAFIASAGTSVPGTIKLIFTAGATSCTLQISGGSGGATATIDSISLRIAEITSSLASIGIDGAASSCSLLTSNTANATILQTITAAATPASSSFYVKRSVGTGRIYFTRNGGTDWLDITNLINSNTFTRVKIENTSVTNPVVGFKIETSGDAIIVDYGQNEAGTECSMPILTTTAVATRNADVLTYQTSGNFSDITGTIVATVKRDNWANNNGVVVGKSGSGLSTSSSNPGAQALDGTNTVSGPQSSSLSRRKIGMKWSGSAMETFAGGNFGAPGSYDGSFNLTTIAIMPQSNGYIKDVAIWQTELSDADMIDVVSDQSDFSAAVSFSAEMYANVIQTGSADLNITFDADFDLGWFIRPHKITATYEIPTITATYK